MAESRIVSVVPLNGSNYATWKVQCKMALIKEGIWKIDVEGTETAPDVTADGYANFVGRVTERSQLWFCRLIRCHTKIGPPADLVRGGPIMLADSVRADK